MLRLHTSNRNIFTVKNDGSKDPTWNSSHSKDRYVSRIIWLGLTCSTAGRWSQAPRGTGARWPPRLPPPGSRVDRTLLRPAAGRSPQTPSGISPTTTIRAPAIVRPAGWGASGGVRTGSRWRWNRHGRPFSNTTPRRRGIDGAPPTTVRRLDHLVWRTRDVSGRMTLLTPRRRITC